MSRGAVSFAGSNASDLQKYEATIEADLARMRRAILWIGGSYAAVTAAALLAACTGYFIFVVRALTPLRDANPDRVIELADIIAADWRLYALAAALGVAGIVTGAAGVWIVRRLLGPQRALPRPAVIAILSLPAFLVATSLFATLAQNAAAGSLAIGPTLALAGWLATPMLVFLCFRQLTMALGQIRRRQTPAAVSELPREAVEFFDSLNDELQEAGLKKLADLLYDSPKGRCRRVWVNGSRTVYASASWVPAASGAIFDFSANSQTEDGRVHETSSLANPGFTIPASIATQFVVLPGATPREVLSRHYQTLADRLAADGVRPMQIAPENEPWLGRHAMSTLMAAKQAEGGAAGVLWLANPYLVTPPGPAPGTPWSPDAVDELALAP
jgi:hypothetical protein